MELAQWLTPSSLFLLLNLMIGTIVLIAKLGSGKNPDQHDHDHDSPHGRLGRASSGLLDRVRSINLSLYKFDPPPNSSEQPDHHPTRELARTPSLLERLMSIRKPDPEPDHDHTVKRSKSDHTNSEVTHAEGKLMTRSASEKGAEIGERIGGGDSGDEDEDEIAMERRRPATTTAPAPAEARRCGAAEEMGVDAKADDFINRFKHQLRLQRLDSLKRFSEMLKGKGTG